MLANQPIRFNRKALAKLKAKALRRGLWFSKLTKEERLHLDLTMKVVEKVKSPLLMKVLKPIVEKLLNATQSKILATMKKIGLSTARKLSQIAQTWGHKTAASWITDFNYIRYLAIMHINTSQLLCPT